MELTHDNVFDIFIGLADAIGHCGRTVIVDLGRDYDWSWELYELAYDHFSCAERPFRVRDGSDWPGGISATGLADLLGLAIEANGGNSDFESPDYTASQIAIWIDSDGSVQASATLDALGGQFGDTRAALRLEWTLTLMDYARACEARTGKRDRELSGIKARITDCAALAAALA